jgi:hypothetical protein
MKPSPLPSFFEPSSLFPLRVSSLSLSLSLSTMSTSAPACPNCAEMCEMLVKMQAALKHSNDCLIQAGDDLKRVKEALAKAVPPQKGYLLLDAEGRTRIKKELREVGKTYVLEGEEETPKVGSAGFHFYTSELFVWHFARHFRDELYKVGRDVRIMRIEVLGDICTDAPGWINATNKMRVVEELDVGQLGDRCTGTVVIPGQGAFRYHEGVLEQPCLARAIETRPPHLSELLEHSC